jgi:hypothetical protein
MTAPTTAPTTDGTTDGATDGATDGTCASLRIASLAEICAFAVWQCLGSTAELVAACMV